MLQRPTCTIGDSLIRVNALIEVTTIKKVLEQLLNLRDTCGATHQDNIMDLCLVHLGIPQGLLHRLEGSTEQVCIEFFETGPGDGSVEICTFVERVDLDAGLGAAGKGTLGAFTGCAEATHGSLVVDDVLFELAFKLSYEMVHHAVVKVLTAQVCVTSSGLHLKDTVLNSQD